MQGETGSRQTGRQKEDVRQRQDRETEYREIRDRIHTDRVKTDKWRNTGRVETGHKPATNIRTGSGSSWNMLTSIQWIASLRAHAAYWIPSKTNVKSRFLATQNNIAICQVYMNDHTASSIDISQATPKSCPTSQMFPRQLPRHFNKSLPTKHISHKISNI